MSQVAFLQREWSAVFEAASRAEASVHADPRTACFYAPRTLELAVSWAYKHDAALTLPYQDNLSALIHELQAGRRRGGVPQGPGDQHARQPRRTHLPPAPRLPGGAVAMPFAPSPPITNAVTAALAAIERARGFLETATLSEDRIDGMAMRERTAAGN